MSVYARAVPTVVPHIEGLQDLEERYTERGLTINCAWHEEEAAASPSALRGEASSKNIVVSDRTMEDLAMEQ